MASSRKHKNKTYDYDWIEGHLALGIFCGVYREVYHRSWPPGYRIRANKGRGLVILRSIKHPFVETKTNFKNLQLTRLRDFDSGWCKYE